LIVSELLRCAPGHFYYIKLGGYDSKHPNESWGGYSQSFVESDGVYSHREVVESDHDWWGICGCKDFDHGTLSTLVFDIDIHKAPDSFDKNRVTVPDNTLTVKSQNGGFHVYFKVHADRGELQESDFQLTVDGLDWDVDIRGSAVSMHVVAPDEIPGVDSPYTVVNNEDVSAVTDPADAASRIQLDNEPLLEYDPGGRVGQGVDIDRDVEPPEEMPTCYHRGLQLRAAAPEDHPNTHKVNVLTALCGLAAGYDVDTLVQHFVDDYPPGPDADREKTQYHIEHIAQHIDRGDYSPPAIGTLKDFGILDDAESCSCDIEYHGGRTKRLSAAEHVQQERQAGEEGEDAETLQQRVTQRVIEPLNPPEDSDIQPIDEDVARQELADILCDEYNFLYPREDTRGWRDTLYVYDSEKGIYEPHGEKFVQQETERLMGAWSSNQRVREIVGKIERRSGVQSRYLDADPERLVVANGVVDLTTGELHDRTPDEYHQTMIDVEYHADAECPRIDDFLHDVVEPGDVPTLYRLIAHSLYKEYTAEKAAMLLGDGRNGKSVFLSLVERFLGEWNVSAKSLQELNEDEWAANNLVGKLANVHPDMSDQTVETMQMFKKLTGRDTVSANVKFESPIRFENYATLIFACNRMPVLKDDTRGNWRRWLLIDFPNTFEPGAEGTIPKQQLMDELTAEEELQGLLAKCVAEVKQWDDGRAWYPTAPGWKQARKRIRRAAEPIYDFAHSCLESEEGGFVKTNDVRRAYQNYAEAEGLPAMTREAFGRKLQELNDYAIEAGQKRVDGPPVRIYKGVTLTSRGEQFATGDVSDGESSQTGIGGPQGRADAVRELCQSHFTGDDGIPHDRLVGMAIGNLGMSVEEAENSIQKSKNQGDIIELPGGDYAPK
jgi:putative DNA primase/helicase